MRSTISRVIRGAMLLATITVGAASAQTAAVPYPEGYRDWHHVKSMIINPGHGLYDAFGGIHHLRRPYKATRVANGPTAR